MHHHHVADDDHDDHDDGPGWGESQGSIAKQSQELVIQFKVKNTAKIYQLKDT
jgi:hypothetical protein